MEGHFTCIFKTTKRTTARFWYVFLMRMKMPNPASLQQKLAYTCALFYYQNQNKLHIWDEQPNMLAAWRHLHRH